MTTLHENTQKFIEISAKDLPLHCPMPDMIKWNAHPRVYMPIEALGEARCPYCGTLYKLQDNALTT
jgi:uncharacterized Zn-finger protein